MPTRQPAGASAALFAAAWGDQTTRASLSTSSDVMWVELLEFEFVAGLGDAHFHAHEARLKTSIYGVVRLSFNRCGTTSLQSAQRSDLVKSVRRSGGIVHSLPPLLQGGRSRSCRSAAGWRDAVRSRTTGRRIDLVRNAERHLCSGGAGYAADAWRTVDDTARRGSLSAARLMWLIGDLFIRNTVDAERAVRDPQLSWPWQGSASVKRLE